MINSSILGTLNVATNVSGTAATPIVVCVPPWQGKEGGGKLQQKVIQGTTGIARHTGQGITHVTKIVITDPNLTTHKVTILRPKNWTYFTNDIAKSVTAFTGVKDDPGVYSTNYRYNGGTAPTTANNAIASGDWIVYQTADGNWQVDKAASSWAAAGGTLTVTTGTPNFTNGKILAGSPLYWFGIITDQDPWVGPAPALAASTTFSGNWECTLPVASLTNVQTMVDAPNGYGLMSARNAGDPLILYDNNITTAGRICYVNGFYSEY